MNIEEQENLFKILRCMARIRTVELYIAERYSEEIMRCPTHLCLGQEAPAAVLGALVNQSDIFFGSYRGHGQYLAKGGNLTALFAELLGRAGGCSGGMGGSPHIIDRAVGFYGTTAIVGGHIPIAAGVAMAKRMRHEAGVIVCFLGDAAMEEGVIYETVNLALLYKLPIIFVCENNRQCVTTPLALRTTHEELYKRFEPMGLPSLRVSGTDVSALFNAAQAMLEISRSGQGPAFIECLVERWAIHVGHTYEGPVDAWWQDPFAAEAERCPIARAARTLISEGSLRLDDLARLHTELRTEVKAAFSAAEKLLPPLPDILQNGVYASGLASILPTTIGAAVTGVTGAHDEPNKLVNPY